MLLFHVWIILIFFSGIAGNFVCDIMLHTTDADVALLNSGTLRSDRVHPKGEFKMKDLMAILPMIDTLVVIRIKGIYV